MEKLIKNKKLFILSKNIDETSSLDLKDFFQDPKRYLESKSKYIVGDKNFINLYKPHSLTKKKKNFSEYDLIGRNKNINDEFGSITTSMNSLSKMKKLHKQLIKEKLISSFTPKGEADKNMNHLYKELFSKKHILYRNKYSFNKNDNNKLENNLSFQKKGIHYEFKTKNQILELFNEHTKKRKKNKTVYRPLSSQKPCFPPKRKISFKEIIKASDDDKKNFEVFSKFLSKKCEREKSELLVNRIKNFNYRKYISNYLQENKLFSERLGNKYWLCDLKRNGKKNEHKTNYVVTGKMDKEPWEQIIDSGMIEHEFINDPSVSEIKIKDNNASEEYKSFIQKFPSLLYFNNLKIEGKNLLNKEIDNFTNNINNNKNIKYRLYKDPMELKKKCINEIIYKKNNKSHSKSTKNGKIKNNEYKI